MFFLAIDRLTHAEKSRPLSRDGWLVPPDGTSRRDHARIYTAAFADFFRWARSPRHVAELKLLSQRGLLCPHGGRLVKYCMTIGSLERDPLPGNLCSKAAETKQLLTSNLRSQEGGGLRGSSDTNPPLERWHVGYLKQPTNKYSSFIFKNMLYICLVVKLLFRGLRWSPSRGLRVDPSLAAGAARRSSTTRTLPPAALDTRGESNPSPPAPR